jgi:hypothetical protein
MWSAVSPAVTAEGSIESTRPTGRRPWRARAAASVGLVVLAVALGLDHEASLVAGFVAGRVAYSTSTAAGLFGAAFVIVGLWLPWPAHGARKVMARITLASAVCGYALHGVLAWRFLGAHGVPANAFAVLYRDGASSFTAWGHSHLGKVGLAALARLTGVDVAAWDSGGVFLPEVPAFAAWGMAALFVATTAGAAGLWAATRRTWGDAWDGRHDAAFAVAALTVAKTLCDGGATAHGALPALVVLASFAWARDARGFAQAWAGRARWAFGIAVAAEVAIALWAADGALPGFGETFARAALLVALLARRSRVIPWALAAFWALQAAVAAESELLPMLAPLPASSTAWRVAADGAGAQTPLPVAGLTPWGVYRAYGDDPRKPRRTLIARPFEADGGVRALPVIVDLLAVTGGRGAIRPPADLWHFGDLHMEAGNRLRFTIETEQAQLPPIVGPRGDAVTKHNLHVWLHWVAARLRDGGVPAVLLIVPRRAGPEPVADPRGTPTGS